MGPLQQEAKRKTGKKKQEYPVEEQTTTDRRNDMRNRNVFADSKQLLCSYISRYELWVPSRESKEFRYGDEHFHVFRKSDGTYCYYAFSGQYAGAAHDTFDFLCMVNPSLTKDDVIAILRAEIYGNFKMEELKSHIHASDMNMASVVAADAIRRENIASVKEHVCCLDSGYDKRCEKALSLRGIQLSDLPGWVQKRVGYISDVKLKKLDGSGYYPVEGVVFSLGLNEAFKIRKTIRKGAAIQYVSSESKYPKAISVGANLLFCPEFLSCSELVFIHEGEFDALSTISLGFPAISVPGVKVVAPLIHEIQKMLDQGLLLPKLVICFDRDHPGEVEAIALKDRLKKQYNIDADVMLLPSENDDINHLLMTDRTLLYRLLSDAQTKALSKSGIDRSVSGTVPPAA